MSWNEYLTLFATQLVPLWALNTGIVILFVFLGIALGLIVKGFTILLLNALKLDAFLKHFEADHLFGKVSFSHLVGHVLEIFTILVIVTQGVAYVGAGFVTEILRMVTYWFPGVIAALFVFTLFYALAVFVERAIHAGKHTQWHVIAPYAMGAIIVFGSIMALKQLGLDTAMLEQAVLIVVFAFALAFALAVGISLGLSMKDEMYTLTHPKTNAPRTPKKKAKRS